MKKVLVLLLWLLGTPALAQNTPPGSSEGLIENNGGSPARFGIVTIASGCTLSSGTLNCPGTGISSYPASGIPQSTGSAWGTSITPGTGVATALALAVNASGGFLTYGGIPYAALPALSANQWLGALTGTTPSGQSWPSCSATGNWLQYTSGTGVGCVTTGYPAGSLSGSSLPAGITGSSLTSLGTIATGVWNGTAIGAQWGGTGQNFSASTGVPSVSSGTWSVTTTPALTATNVTGLPPHQIALSLECASSTGSSSSTAYTCTTTPSFTPVNGDQILWLPGTNDLTNTTAAPTLNVNGTTAYQIVGNGNSSIIQGDVATGAAAQSYSLQFSTAAAAPCSSHCWILDAGQRNSWLSTYANATNNSLKAFYACNPQVSVCRVIDNADSEHTCWLTSTCAFGPQHEVNLWAASLLSIWQRRGFPIYSTGLIGPISIVSTASLFSNGVLPGITCTGTVTQVSLSGVGPQQATGALTGGGTLQMASGAVCTVAISTFVSTAGGTAGAFNRFRVYCAINSTTGNMTVTISGQSASTACTGTNASPLAQAFTVTNTAGTTALTVAITCTTGTCNLGGYEEIYTTNNFGYAVDAFEAAGGANSYWLGAATGNAAYLKLTTGTVALLDIAIGINDAAGSIASATVNANIATFISNWPAASVLIWSSFAYTGTGSTNYPAIQAGEQQYALTNGYDFLNTSDNSTTNTSVNYWNGIQNSDFTHPTDMGAGANFAQWWAHINGSEAQASLTFGANQVPYQNGFISFIDGTDTSSINGLASICYATGVTYCGIERLVSAPAATFQSMWARGIAATTQTASNGAVAPLGSLTFGYSNTAGTQVPAAAQFSWINDPATGLDLRAVQSRAIDQRLQYGVGHAS